MENNRIFTDKPPVLDDNRRLRGQSAYKSSVTRQDSTCWGFREYYFVHPQSPPAEECRRENNCLNYRLSNTVIRRVLARTNSNCRPFIVLHTGRVDYRGFSRTRFTPDSYSIPNSCYNNIFCIRADGYWIFKFFDIMLWNRTQYLQVKIVTTYYLPTRRTCQSSYEQ